ncbi:MAG: hypothetical protein IPN65_04605 [Elusimicrobia bacterium]|nr:hypothetical protein [Elusimicrobiota bacterium]
MRKFQVKGFALGMVALFMLFLIPMAFTLIQRTVRLNRTVWREQASGVGRRLASEVMVDYMSQFSKGSGYYEDHFSASSLARTASIFSAGGSTATVIPNPAARTILIRAQGKARTTGQSTPEKNIEALIRFIPLVGQFAFEFPFNFTDNVPGDVYDGPVRVGMNFNVAGANIIFNQPVLVGQNLNARMDTRFNSQVYHGGTLNPAYTPVVYTAGVPIPDVSPTKYFSIDPVYYANICTTSSLVTTWWEFQDNAGVGEFRSTMDQNGDFNIDGADGLPGPWTPVPASGGVFFTWNVKTFVSGTVRGRVTIVSGCSGGAPNDGVRGAIEVVGAFGYPGAQLYANPQSSIFLLAGRRFILDIVVNGPTTMAGAFYVENPIYNSPECGGGGDASLIRRRGGGGCGGRPNQYLRFLEQLRLMRGL